MADDVLELLVNLAGQIPAFPENRDLCKAKANELLAGSGIGYSQFNELLLLLGFDRVSGAFFQFIVDGATAHKIGSALHSLGELEVGVDRFRKVAALNFGNIKFGFKYLSNPETDLEDELEGSRQRDTEEFKKRHDALIPVDTIAGEETYYLGYLVDRQIKEKLALNKNDEQAKAEAAKQGAIVERGVRNQEAYLASDHMDVYVATSMRERHEYLIISEVVREVFNDANLKQLKLRWFDPTQAYCKERIDKGLAEALMLKRAACTLYLAQESDTLGKDSELACTLAQGKPVIAFVPKVEEGEEAAAVEKLLKSIAKCDESVAEHDILLRQLRVFYPEGAWEDPEIQGWAANPQGMDLDKAKERLGERIRAHYDNRAGMLKDAHPLGIQVHLATGVANGVLVARTTAECAVLIHQIVTRTLEFTISEKMLHGIPYLLLKENITGSTFRVVTGDRFLTNAFWNYYLAK